MERLRKKLAGVVDEDCKNLLNEGTRPITSIEELRDMLKKRLIELETQKRIILPDARAVHDPKQKSLRKHGYVVRHDQLPSGVVREASHEYACLDGGNKVMKQEWDGGQFLRTRDNAWFHFALTVREQHRRVELIAYNFELVFFNEAQRGSKRGPSFIRFDLNEPDHPNNDKDLRCHLHVGVDEEGSGKQLPFPIAHPLDLLDFVSTHTLHD